MNEAPGAGQKKRAREAPDPRDIRELRCAFGTFGSKPCIQSEKRKYMRYITELMPQVMG